MSRPISLSIIASYLFIFSLVISQIIPLFNHNLPWPYNPYNMFTTKTSYKTLKVYRLATKSENGKLTWLSTSRDSAVHHKFISLLIYKNRKNLKSLDFKKEIVKLPGWKHILEKVNSFSTTGEIFIIKRRAIINSGRLKPRDTKFKSTIWKNVF